MKHTLFVMICLMFLVGINVKTYANETYTIQLEYLQENSEDYENILQLEPQIRATLNNYLKDLGNEPLSEEDVIPLNLAQKDYLDPTIFSMESNKTNDIKNALQQCEYMYYLPITIDNHTFDIHIAQTSVVTEAAKENLSTEELQTLAEQAGQWELTAVTQRDHVMVKSEQQQIQDALHQIGHTSEEIIVYICGGLPSIGGPFAIILNNEEAQLIIPLGSLTVDGTEEEIAAAKPQSASESDNIYLYPQMKAAANATYEKLYAKQGVVGETRNYVSFSLEQELHSLSESKNTVRIHNPEDKNPWKYGLMIAAGMIVITLFVIYLIKKHSISTTH